MNLNEFNQKDLIELEINRLSSRYNKDYLDCENIMKITGLSKNNIRTLMSNPQFPTTKIGRRKVVSLTNFVIWQYQQNNK